jgi:hypothetical protein
VRHALIATLAGAVAAAACASPGQPPGGPDDKLFPRIVAILPESNAVNAKPNRVLVRFDDVISEQAGGGDLSRLVLVSPWDGGVDVAWRRTGLSIRPRKGWRPNTPYTITVLPGIQDLRNNVNKEGLTFRFSTGATLPTTAIRGVVFDWTTAKPLARALVQVVDRRDTTLAYVTATDSTGRFELRTVPPGAYLLRAVDEKGTPNRLLDPREPWDSTALALADSARAELYVVVRDTIAPRIQTLERRDSVTVLLTLDRPIDPTQRIDTSLVRIVAPDSTPVALAEVVSGTVDRARQAREDSVRIASDTSRRTRRTLDPTQRLDTAVRAPLPIAKREALASELVVRVREAFTAGNYRITVTGVRGILGATAPATRTLVVPRAAPADTGAARTTRDTARTRGTAPGAVTVPRDTLPTGRPIVTPRDTTPRRVPADTARRPGTRPPVELRR